MTHLISNLSAKYGLYPFLKKFVYMKFKEKGEIRGALCVRIIYLYN